MTQLKNSTCSGVCLPGAPRPGLLASAPLPAQAPVCAHRTPFFQAITDWAARPTTGAAASAAVSAPLRVHLPSMLLAQFCLSCFGPQLDTSTAKPFNSISGTWSCGLESVCVLYAPFVMQMSGRLDDQLPASLVGLRFASTLVGCCSHIPRLTLRAFCARLLCLRSGFGYYCPTVRFVSSPTCLLPPPSNLSAHQSGLFLGFDDSRSRLLNETIAGLWNGHVLPW